MDKNLVYHFFSDDDFLRITKKIKETELITSGEIVVSIKENKSFKNRKKNIREISEEEFFRLNMEKTRDKTGVLLLLVLDERQFYILADEGINSKVDSETWGDVRDEIQDEFRNGRYTRGLLAGIEKVGQILSEHFPRKDDDTNELSNRVIV